MRLGQRREEIVGASGPSGLLVGQSEWPHAFVQRPHHAGQRKLGPDHFHQLHRYVSLLLHSTRLRHSFSSARLVSLGLPQFLLVFTGLLVRCSFPPITSFLTISTNYSFSSARLVSLVLPQFLLGFTGFRWFFVHFHRLHRSSTSSTKLFVLWPSTWLHFVCLTCFTRCFLVFTGFCWFLVHFHWLHRYGSLLLPQTFRSLTCFISSAGLVSLRLPQLLLGFVESIVWPFPPITPVRLYFN